MPEADGENVRCVRILGDQVENLALERYRNDRIRGVVAPDLGAPENVQRGGSMVGSKRTVTRWVSPAATVNLVSENLNSFRLVFVMV